MGTMGITVQIMRSPGSPPGAQERCCRSMGVGWRSSTTPSAGEGGGISLRPIIQASERHREVLQCQ